MYEYKSHIEKKNIIIIIIIEQNHIFIEHIYKSIVKSIGRAYLSKQTISSKNIIKLID